MSAALTPEQAGHEALSAMGPMLAGIREVVRLALRDDDPRWQAAIGEKLRVLALIERSKASA